MSNLKFACLCIFLGALLGGLMGYSVFLLVGWMIPR